MSEVRTRVLKVLDDLADTMGESLAHASTNGRLMTDSAVGTTDVAFRYTQAVCLSDVSELLSSLILRES